MNEIDSINPVQEQMEVEKDEPSNLENSVVNEVGIIGNPDTSSEANKFDQTTYKLEF